MRGILWALRELSESLFVSCIAFNLALDSKYCVCGGGGGGGGEILSQLILGLFSTTDDWLCCHDQWRMCGVPWSIRGQ